MTAAADHTVEYLLRRIQRDPRLAYYFGHTESLELLIKARAEAGGLDLESFRKDYGVSLTFETPKSKYEERLVSALQDALNNLDGIAVGDDTPSFDVRDNARSALHAAREG